MHLEISKPQDRSSGDKFQMIQQVEILILLAAIVCLFSGFGAITVYASFLKTR